ncbi:MAG: DotU family type IV/VI secretion system protein [Nitrospiraceae bacterium]|nr:MAG: DotU family type IV/VI secretion system protein [Nitrospiraceae bacterium]
MHLTDCFMELVAYVAYFKKTVNTKQPPFEQVKADVTRLLTQSENCLRKGLYPQDEFDQARFAVCAWVDEVVLGSAWTHKGLWQRELLQRIYYNTAEAGEEFFERLNNVGLHQRDVREVYYLCLALGFMGRYGRKGDEFLLEQLKASNLKLLAGSSVGVPSLERTDLFPEAYSAAPVDMGPQKQKFRFSLFNIIMLAAPIVLFGLLFIIYRFSLSGIGENFLNTLQR